MKTEDYKGKRAIVTGGADGIGREIALALAREGCRLLVADLNGQAVQQFCEELAKQGTEAHAVTADVSVEQAVDEIFDAARVIMGGFDILINNAGISHPAVSILDLDLEYLDRVFKVDYKGVYLCSRRAGRDLIGAGKGGVIINISSIAGITPLPLTVYGPMKAAVNMLTRILARDWAAHQIRVNAVAPGYVLTPLIKGMIDRGERDPGRLIKQTPMKTLLEPEEVAQAVLFLASGQAAHITGAVLPVDAGWLADGGWAAYPGQGGLS